MRFLFCIVAGLGFIGSAAADSPSRQPQRVIISFDGAHDLRQWQRSRDLARATGARFTYFLSCTFLLSRQNRKTYRGPDRTAGKSNVGFAASRADVGARLQHIWLARREGHEIASHGCGHFDGKKWSRTQWQQEFGAFSRILKSAWTTNRIGNEPTEWRAFADKEILGFRAPYLSTGTALYTALRETGFAYDASAVSRGVRQHRTRKGFHHFALPMIPEGPSARRILAMDYNLFVRHSAAIERPSKGPQFEERTYQALRRAFQRQYGGGRIPLQMGFHFTLMNGGAYWRALERFAREVCPLPDVECISYRDLLNRSPANRTSGES